MIEASSMLSFIAAKGQHIYSFYSWGALLARSDKGERAMSLRSVTEKIDTAIFGAVLVICLLIWAALGFPLIIEIATTAALVFVIYCFWLWMESRH
jgi:hypothetical protein